MLREISRVAAVCCSMAAATMVAMLLIRSMVPEMRPIASIQSITGETVAAIQTTGTTVAQINEITASIASAVEEQRSSSP